jgi:hypothetical protein
MDEWLHALELGQKQRTHVFDPGRHAGVRPTRARTRRRARSSPPRASLASAPIKASSPWTILASAPHTHRAQSPEHWPWTESSTARQAARAPATAASSPQPSLAHTSSLVSFAGDPSSFPNPQTERNLTGSTRSPSSDFFRSPESVDRVRHCIISKFLAHTASTSLGKAPCTNQLNYSTVVRPRHSPPMSSPACAWGPTDSDHLRRRPAHRRDRRNFPDLPGHLTRARSPPVSLAALFSAAFTLPIRLGARVRFRLTLGGFLHCQRLGWIVARGPVCKGRRKYMQGTLAQSRFPFPFKIQIL